ncbi:glycosyltransferase family 2 protein [Paenibacillus sp. FSL K6-1217]|uniref:glycosyltransferase family 2 protein n=1 Tax=Paenibacillus sp. FSL K6-1217 TaxID=2921466 RepID=UPI0032534D58
MDLSIEIEKDFWKVKSMRVGVFLLFRIKKLLFFMLGFFGVRINLKLVPINDLREINNEWIVVGPDPHFLVEGNILNGWNELYWESNSDEKIPLKMYWDDGRGFSEFRSMIIAEIPKGVTLNKTFLYIPNEAKTIRFDPGEKEIQFSFKRLKIRKISRVSIALRSFKKYRNQRGISFRGIGGPLKKAWGIYRNKGIRSLWIIIKQTLEYSNEDTVDDYLQWMEKSRLTDSDIIRTKQSIEELEYKPLISIVVPVYNVEEVWLRKCIDSVRGQFYPNWELCISDDASTKSHIKKVLKEYQEIDPKIKVVFRNLNGHISNSSNSALEIASGEFIALLDHDDELTPDALYENVLLLNEFPAADVIYSDEDKISVEGERFSPFFKPDWSPDLLMSQMYTCHLSVYRKSLIDHIGGFRVGYEGSQDFDLMLRVTELTSNIYHIPKILYHWRAIPTSTASNGSTKDYTHVAGLKAIEDAIHRRALDATVESIEGHSNVYLMRYKPTHNPKISIIIPTKNMSSVLRQCLESIFNKTTYANFEVIIVDNGSNETDVFELYRHYESIEEDRFKVHALDIPFNYSKLNNFGVEKASGELILLLNNDVEVITGDWLQEMAGQALRKEIGAVGACLYYPDNTIQHGGVILGIGGVAGHSHKYFNSDHTGYYRRLKIVSNYTAVTAACLMLRKDVYNEVNGLEEELQVAFNDVDLCLKIWSSGYNNVWLPHVKLYHYESKSRGHEDTIEKQERFSKEIAWVKNRWSNLLENDPAYNPNLSKVKEDYSIGEPVKVLSNNLGVRCLRANNKKIKSI